MTTKPKYTHRKIHAYRDTRTAIKHRWIFSHMCTETLTFSYIHRDRLHTICMFTYTCAHSYIGMHMPYILTDAKVQENALAHGVKSVSRKEKGGEPDNSVGPIEWTNMHSTGRSGRDWEVRKLGFK